MNVTAHLTGKETVQYTESKQGCYDYYYVDFSWIKGIKVNLIHLTKGQKLLK